MVAGRRRAVNRITFCCLKNTVLTDIIYHTKQWKQ
jgi:hypothetical protein